MNKKIIPLYAIILLLIPVIVAFMINIPAPMKYFDTTNAWIGFWGSYLGGICTLIGVIATIMYSIKVTNDNKHDSIRPYLTVKQLYKTEIKNDIKDLKPWDYHIGVIYGGFGDPDGDVTFDEFETYGEITNVGLGTALNVSIENIRINNFQLTNTNSHHALACYDTALFQICYLRLSIKKDKLPKAFNNGYEAMISNKSSEIPELILSFDICYEDMLEKYYKQKVTYTVQVLEGYEANIIGARAQQQKEMSKEEIKKLKEKKDADN